jgi:hypothetical protein
LNAEDKVAIMFLFEKENHFRKPFHCRTKPIVLGELIMRIPSGFQFNTNFILSLVFDEIVKQLIPTGIVQKFHNDYYEFVHKQRFDYDQKEPKILQINDLSFGFVLWLGACGLSLSAFLCEKFMEFSKGRFKI